MQNGHDDHERRIRALEEARKELEDSFIVMTHLETKQSNVIRQQAEAIQETDKRIKQQAEAIDEQRRLNQETDKRIADLVSAIGKLISKMPNTQL
jgi:galactokinase/mevalonate kinase-like predicted kinase